MDIQASYQNKNGVGASDQAVRYPTHVQGNFPSTTIITNCKNVRINQVVTYGQGNFPSTTIITNCKNVCINQVVCYPTPVKKNLQAPSKKKDSLGPVVGYPIEKQSALETTLKKTEKPRDSTHHRSMFSKLCSWFGL